MPSVHRSNVFSSTVAQYARMSASVLIAQLLSACAPQNAIASALAPFDESVQPRSSQSTYVLWSLSTPSMHSPSECSLPAGHDALAKQLSSWQSACPSPSLSTPSVQAVSVHA